MRPLKARLAILAGAAAIAAASPQWSSGLGRRPPRGEGVMRNAPELADVQARPLQWAGASCAEAAPSATVITHPNEWDALWRRAFGKLPPDVDFKTYVAVAVFLGPRPTGGWSVEFLEPLADDASARFRYRVRPPGPGRFVIQAFTLPYAVRLYRNPRRPSEVIQAGE